MLIRIARHIPRTPILHINLQPNTHKKDKESTNTTGTELT